MNQKLLLSLFTVFLCSQTGCSTDSNETKEKDERRVCEQEITDSYNQFVGYYNQVREEESSGNDELYNEKIKTTQNAGTSFLARYDAGTSCGAVASETDNQGVSTISRVNDKLQTLAKDSEELATFLASPKSKVVDRNNICRAQFTQNLDAFIDDMQAYEKDMKQEIDALQKAMDEKIKDAEVVKELMDSIMTVYNDKVSRYDQFMKEYSTDATCYRDENRDDVIRISRIRDLGKSQSSQKVALDSLTASVEKYIQAL